MNSNEKEFRLALESESSSYDVRLTTEQVGRLTEYYKLLSVWNPRLHLVAPATPREFATRHVLESLLLIHHLPQKATLADVGSGGGLPAIPCLIVRPDIKASLIESSKKKAVFLREALDRVATPRTAEVIAKRFKEVTAPDVGFVTCRALERFGEKVPTMIEWAPGASTLLLFGGASLRQSIEKTNRNFKEIRIPNSERRFLFVIKRKLNLT